MNKDLRNMEMKTRNLPPDRLIKGDRKTQSGIEVKDVYGPEDISHISFENDRLISPRLVI